LVDTRWAVALLGGTAPAAFDTAASLTLQFGGRDTVIGNGGCTAFRGPATGGNTRLGLGPLTAGTASCGEAIDRQERTYLELLQATAGYVVVDDELLLLDATGKELVRLSKVE
jgi:heat shock protein HslJ